LAKVCVSGIWGTTFNDWNICVYSNDIDFTSNIGSSLGFSP
jgi:hypothetical protein